MSVACTRCGSTNTVPIGKETKWDVNVGYNTKWTVNNNAKQQFFCNVCNDTFESKPYSPSQKEALLIPISFDSWDYEIVKIFYPKSKKYGCFLKIFKQGSLTYLGVAFGNVAKELIGKVNLSDQYIAELRYDKEQQDGQIKLKLFFNDEYNS